MAIALAQTNPTHPAATERAFEPYRAASGQLKLPPRGPGGSPANLMRGLAALKLAAQDTANSKPRPKMLRS